jgi:hypothetical protein
MNKVFKILGVILESYVLGIAVILISAIVLALSGVEINPISGNVKWNIGTLIIGFLIYGIKS